MGLKFTAVEIRVVRLPFRFSYAHALASRSENESIILSISTDSGHSGYGETIPRQYLTGETVPSVLADAERFARLLRGVEVESFAELLPKLAPIYELADKERKTAAYCALELACIDAAGKAFALPARLLAAALGAGSDEKIRYTLPVGTSSPKKAMWLARVARWMGFRDLKLKLGMKRDAELLAAVRQRAGWRGDLRVDANCGWNVSDALAGMEMLRASGVTSIEQPLPAAELEGMAKIQREGGLPLMADESLCTRQDAHNLINAQACKIFNIRLAKCGGFSGCLAQIKLARQHGLDCQLGVLVGETSILTAAEQEFLAGSGAMRHHEFGFPRLFLACDPARGASGVFMRGEAKPRQPQPGFGISVLPEALERVTCRSVKVDI